jgi:cell wall-associated NlpC family hydrolase
MSGALLRRGAVVLALLGLLAAPMTVPALAEPDLGSARAAADALRTKVDRLTAQAEAAAEDYGAAALALEDVVSALLSADQGVDDATRAADRATGRTADAARQLYMSGGPGAIYASVLDGDDISDVLSRMASVDSVVAGDIVASDEALDDLAAATAAHADLAALTARKRALEATRAAARDRAAALRAQAAAALRGAEDVVRRLVEEERAAAEARAEAAARATVTAPWGSASVPADSYAAIDRAVAEARADPATPYAVAALLDARRWLGTPYSAGGGGRNGPSTGWCSSAAPDDGRTDDGDCAAERTVGFDCSSLMLRVFSVAGLNLPRTSRQQWYAGQRVPLADVRPGDLLFWAYDTSRPTSIHHVALYLGNGLMVHAPHTGDHVRVAEVYLRGFIGAVRPG